MTGDSRAELQGRVVRYGVILTGICLIAGVALSGVYVVSKNAIAENNSRAFRKTLQEVMGEGEDPRPLGSYESSMSPEDMVYVATIENGVRYAAIGSHRGYQSLISVLASVDAPKADAPVGDDPAIHAVAVVSSAETPGLGEDIRKVEPDLSLWGAVAGVFTSGPRTQTGARARFLEQFSGKNLSDLVVEKKADGDKIAAVTGATISSRAATGAVREAVDRIIKRTRELHGSSPQTRSPFETALKSLLHNDGPDVVGRYPETTSPEDKVYGARSSGKTTYAAVGLGQGYRSQIRVVVSVESATERSLESDPVISGIIVISGDETPGLGDRVYTGTTEERVFEAQFVGKRLSELKLQESPKPEGIAAVTGATFTSRAAVEAAVQATQRIVSVVQQTRGEK